MIEALFNQPNYVATKKLMDATVMRHEAIASNLANSETPQYKRLDIVPSFKEELNNALNSGSPGQIAQVEPRLAVDATAIPQGRDGNTVQMENELLQLSQNSLAHAVEGQMITASLVRLRLAITGK
jgi:flagellar basal-body rod protein FlgB